ncbi:MAG: hypothetical protein H0U52_10360 [Chloroflexi bacterium]|nr:hypothetical protein [Chloroflexota bacterium]
MAKGPERLSIVFASRRVPSVPVAKLRSLGELAEIGIADLRFSDIEMEQLFRETYGRPLEPDVLVELAKRTEGWAASLTLVQAALRERTPAETRAFVRGLSGARDELHDYLAEEVVGDLPTIQQQFLMRTSILQRVTPELAQVASGLSAVEVQSMIGDAERLGMLGRRANRRASEQRYHPLVREFLEERLTRDVGGTGVDALHVAVAAWAESSDWRTAAHHYASATRWLDLLRVLELHLERIVASGAFSAAADFVRMFPEAPRSAAIEVIASRQASVEGDIARVVEHALRATEIDPGNDAAKANLITGLLTSGRFADALTMTENFMASAKSDLLRQVAAATSALIRASVDMDLVLAEQAFTALAERSRREGLAHYEGVSLLNAGLTLRSQGAMDRALANASMAIDCLANSSSGSEWASACFLKASLIGYSGEMDTARALFVEAGRTLRHGARAEFLGEFADFETQVGDAQAAQRLIAEVDLTVTHSMAQALHLVRVGLAIRAGDLGGALTVLENLRPDSPSNYSGHVSRVRATAAVVATLQRSPEAANVAREALAFADRQNAGLWREVASICLAGTLDQLDGAVLGLPARLQFVLSIVTELLVMNLEKLSEASLDRVAEEAIRRPSRWLPALRVEISRAARPQVPAVARLLARVGSHEVVALLNSAAKDRRLSGTERHLGKVLARRLAPQVVIEDLARLSITVGTELVGGHEVRRKVLALLCFLASRPRFSATREEVMDAMWPDIEPSAAINSLNQSVYFLRRIFEPEYSEDTSAGYVHQDSDLIWLDSDLVDSRSQMCARLVARFERDPGPTIARQLSGNYAAKFALDFSYEEWSSDYREWLHVSYLRVIDRQVRSHVDARRLEEAIQLARRAVEVDPGNEDLALALLRLLRSSGAHSAAAEQYAYYSDLLKRELGLEAPPIESL